MSLLARNNLLSLARKTSPSASHKSLVYTSGHSVPARPFWSRGPFNISEQAAKRQRNSSNNCDASPPPPHFVLPLRKLPVETVHRLTVTARETTRVAWQLQEENQRLRAANARLPLAREAAGRGPRQEEEKAGAQAADLTRRIDREKFLRTCVVLSVAERTSISAADVHLLGLAFAHELTDPCLEPGPTQLSGPPSCSNSDLVRLVRRAREPTFGLQVACPAIESQDHRAANAWAAAYPEDALRGLSSSRFSTAINFDPFDTVLYEERQGARDDSAPRCITGDAGSSPNTLSV